MKSSDLARGRRSPSASSVERRGDRERVVDLEHVDVRRGDARPARTRPRPSRRAPVRGEVVRPRSSTCWSCARRSRAPRPACCAQVAGPLQRGEHDRSAAVGDQAAVGDGQRAGDHRCAPSTSSTVSGPASWRNAARVQQRPLARGDRDLGELLARAAVPVQVLAAPPSRSTTAGTAGRTASRTAPPGVCASSTPPRLRERAERWLDAKLMTTTEACPASIACAARATYHLEAPSRRRTSSPSTRGSSAEVVGELGGREPRDAGGGEPVDVGEGQPGVGERPGHRLGLQREDRPVR